MKFFANYFFFALPLLLTATLLVSFSCNRNERIRGNGEVKEESRNAAPFKDISTSGAYKVIIQQGSGHSIRIAAEENLLPYIQTEISGGELQIYTRKGYNIQPTKDITVYVTMEKVGILSASGASGFISKGTLNSDLLELRFSGAADAKLDINARKLKVGVSGASKIKLSGTSNSAEYGVSGAADIRALDLATDDAQVDISGTGKAEVFVQKKLDVGISGMGNVHYKGDPSVTKSISGAGNISKI